MVELDVAITFQASSVSTAKSSLSSTLKPAPGDHAHLQNIEFISYNPKGPEQQVKHDNE
jgi:hypothetical protein